MTTSRFGDEAKYSIDFDVADIEHYQDFADQVSGVLPFASTTFHETPMFGGPYVQVDIRGEEPWDSFTLMVDAGQTLHIGSKEVWVTTDER